MSRPIIKFLTDFGPLLIFFIIYFKNDHNLMLAIPPFVGATLLALGIVYFLEKKIPMMPLTSGIIITLFGGLTLYFDNKIFFYMKPTIVNLLFASILFFGKYFTQKPLLKIFSVKFTKSLYPLKSISENFLTSLSIDFSSPE